MEKILGLDLGTNSIGWAIRQINEELENQIIDKGVLTFEKGVAEDKSGEHPMVQIRTEARGRRRNYQAEKYRKYELIECLIENKMCPLTILELNKWRHYKKNVGRKYPISEIFHQWLRFDFDGDGKPDFENFGFSKHENCYLFRWLAVSENETHKKIFNDHPQLFGRVLYQMVQRRGFNKGDDIEETKLIEEGRKNPETKTVEVVGVKVIEKLIKEKYKTLGSALYWGQKNNELEVINNNRIRNRFTYRNYFANELDTIFHNLGFDKESDFCKKVKKCITWQRPLRSQKGLVGYCTLDAPLKSRTGVYYKSGKKRIPLSHPLYEEFRTWQFINNLKIELPEEINKIHFLQNKVFPLFNRTTDFYFSNKKSGKTEIKGLKTKIQDAGGKVLAKYDKDLDEDNEGTRYNANVFQFKLENLFGDNWKAVLRWDETLNGVEKSGNYLRAEDIWHLFYDAIITKNQTEEIGDMLIPILKKHFPEINFDKKDFESRSLGNKGYGSLSASAIRKILPYLKQGMIYSQAVFIANIEKVLEKKLSIEQIKSITSDFEEIVKRHKSDKEVYRVVNDLISDRLYYLDRIGMGDKYELDEYDKKDIDKKIKDTFKAKIWNKKTTEEKHNFISEISELYKVFLRQPIGINKSKLFHKIYRIDNKLNDLLIKKYKADPERVKKYLWHPSEQEKYPPANFKKDYTGNLLKDKDGKEILFLGDPNPISRGFKNPMAMKTLHILKKHLNYLLKVGKIDASTKILVEIARELNDTNKRKAIEQYQNANRKKRDGFKTKIEECYKESNISLKEISESMLDRYELWEEQSKKCMYCTNEISCSDLLNGTAQVEHTIPAGISNCDELFNLTIAHPECNSKKAKRIPFEWKNNYELIKKNVGFIYAKYMGHKENFESTFDRARSAKNKKAKDSIIVKRHLERMFMDYWRKKYETFVMEEVLNQFRRQQLTDTQIITKYALPYLRTVFNRVDIQKGITTAKFRKIFEIQPPKKDKDRTEHTHHYEDAAVLTLIPPPSIRDNLMKAYNEAVDNNALNSYNHPKPIHWKDFRESHITSLNKEIIINHISQDRTLKQTFKYKRKRGKLVKDKDGKSILLEGDTTRGKLHDESIFGMIKMPETEFRDNKHRLKIINGKLSFRQNEKRNDELFVVKKIKLIDIKSIDDFEKIMIDPNLLYYLKNEIKSRMEKQEKKFEEIILQQFYAFGKEKDKNGNQLQPIRHIRCKVKGGGGGFVNNPIEIKPIDKSFESRREYKRTTYALNGETPICALYEWKVDGKTERELIPIPVLDIGKSYHGGNESIVEERISYSIGKGKKKIEFIKELITLLRVGQHVIFFKENENIENLKEIYKTDSLAFNKRIYKINEFEKSKKIKFNFHRTSLSKDDVKKAMLKRDLPADGASKIDFDNPIILLRLAQSNLNMVTEGLHFEIKIDGTINWLL